MIVVKQSRLQPLTKRDLHSVTVVLTDVNLRHFKNIWTDFVLSYATSLTQKSILFSIRSIKLRKKKEGGLE